MGDGVRRPARLDQCQPIALFGNQPEFVQTGPLQTELLDIDELVVGSAPPECERLRQQLGSHDRRRIISIAEELLKRGPVHRCAVGVEPVAPRIGAQHALAAPVLKVSAHPGDQAVQSSPPIANCFRPPDRFGQHIGRNRPAQPFGEQRHQPPLPIPGDLDHGTTCVPNDERTEDLHPHAVQYGTEHAVSQLYVWSKPGPTAPSHG